MNVIQGPSYDRVPGCYMRELLSADGFLAPLLMRRMVEGAEVEVHLRPGDEAHLYCGLTCLIKAGAGAGTLSGSKHTQRMRSRLARKGCSGLDKGGTADGTYATCGRLAKRT